MASFRPSVPFSSMLIVLKPTVSMVAGVPTKTLPSLENGFKIFCSFKSYGGTETNVDGLISIDDTAEVQTWYRPDITSDCIVVNPLNNAQYEIMNEPENIEMRNQFLLFKVKRVKGGV